MKAATETQCESSTSSNAEAGSVEALLMETGLAALTVASKTSAQENALKALAVVAADLPPLRRALLRDQAVQGLKRGGFGAPPRPGDGGMPPPVGETPSGPGSGPPGGSPPPRPEAA